MGKKGTQCCAFGCKKRRKSKVEQEVQRSDSDGSEDEETEKKRKLPRTFHSFPFDPARRAQWASNMHREGWSPTVHSKICSDHFVERYLNRSGQRVEVRCEAIPTRFKKLPKDIRMLLKEQELALQDVDGGTTSNKNNNKKSDTAENGCDQTEITVEQITEHTRSISTQTLSNQVLENEVTCLKKDKMINKANADHQYYIADSPKKLKARLDKTTDHLLTMKRKLKVAQQKTRRLQSRIKSHKAIIKCLRSKYQVLEKNNTALQNYYYASTFVNINGTKP